MNRRRGAFTPDPRLTSIVATFWLSEGVTPANAWKLLATLKASGPAYAPATFKTSSLPRGRMLGRRSGPIVAESLARGEDVELLRRAGTSPRILLRSVNADGTRTIDLSGPMLGSMPEAMDYIELVKAIYDLLHPRLGVVNGSNGSGSKEPGRIPGWLTVFGPEKVREIGASRLLMAPAFLIETFQDGGLLVAASPLPWEDGRADRRSSALAEYLQGDGVWPGAPFVRQGVELIVT